MLSKSKVYCQPQDSQYYSTIQNPQIYSCPAARDNFTFNGGLSHKLYDSWSTQPAHSGNNSISKCHNSLVRIRRISAYARLDS